MRFKTLNTAFMLLLSIGLLFSCTVVKHNEKSQKSDTVSFYFEDESFDAVSFIREIWDAKIILHMQENSEDLTTLLDDLRDNPKEAYEAFGIKKEELSPYTFIVRGTLKIREINRDSSAGLLILDLPDLTDEGYCEIQIGPVIKKSMVRDSLEFIKFGDFNNQIEFANISREINFYIRDNVVSKVDDSWQAGMSVKFCGAFTVNDTGNILITPVSLELVSSDGEANE